MEYSDKRTSALDRGAVQHGNKSWGTAHTMSYDWSRKTALAPYTLPWFDDIDRRFLQAARLFSDAANPFAEIMKVPELAGRRVLEIGCGMGFHSELLARAGAVLTSIDLSPTSVKATRTRLELKGLPAEVREKHAETAALPSEEFDMVWLWGVIHHSSRTGASCGRSSACCGRAEKRGSWSITSKACPAHVTLVTRYLLGFWRGRSLDEALWRSTDGFSARFYTRDEFADLLATFFDRVETRIFGQDADVVPLPRFLRGGVLRLIPLTQQRQLASRRGAFLFAVATKAAATKGIAARVDVPMGANRQ